MNINAPDYPSQHFSSQSPANHRVTSAAIRVSVLSNSNWLPIEEEVDDIATDPDYVEIASGDEVLSLLDLAERRNIYRPPADSLDAVQAYELVESAYQVVGIEGIIAYLEMRQNFAQRIDPESNIQRGQIEEAFADDELPAAGHWPDTIEPSETVLALAEARANAV